MTDLFDNEIDSGEFCPSSIMWSTLSNHPLRLVAEGYAICYSNNHVSAWSRTEPASPGWSSTFVKDYGWWLGDGSIAGWSREQAIAFIQTDIEAHRNRPFDEEVERTRLMPV